MTSECPKCNNHTLECDYKCDQSHLNGVKELMNICDKIGSSVAIIHNTIKNIEALVIMQDKRIKEIESFLEN